MKEKGVIMIVMRKGVFETNSSSTHSLVLKNELLEENIDSNLNQYNFKIKIFDGSPGDRKQDNTKYSVYEGKFIDVVDKLRYLYTCMCQYGLYYHVDVLNKIYLNDSVDNKAYSLYLLLTEALPNVTFVPPDEARCYVFEDCEYIVDEIIDTGIFNDVNILKLFLSKGQVIYCDRDEDYILSDNLYEIAKNNKYSICISG